MKPKLLLLPFVLLSLNSFCQTNDNLISIQGNAIICEIPELFVTNISISSQDSLYSKCSDLLIENYNQIEMAFEKNGIPKKELKSGGINISESYSWTGRERKMNGYQGNISVILELPYNKQTLNTVINTLKNNEFPVSYNLSFKLSNSQKETLLKKAIELAIENAEKKANYIAESMGFKLSKIKDINFGYTSYKNDILTDDTNVFSMIEEEEVMEQDISLNPQKLEIKKTIGVVWIIEE
ncbi:MAG: SIMPL domain-containing protein [Bacteroidales bacterium]|nr:SIMPL domain-containing protein [Bacteroidales bacterium]